MSLRYLVKMLSEARVYPKKLENWGKTTTIEEVYQQFLHTAFHGHEDQWVPFNIIKPLERENFNSNVSTFHTTPTGEIDLTDVFNFLCQAHPIQAQLIQSAKPYLTALLYAHARFPFSKPVPLTRDALLRAIILLTSRGKKFFSREVMRLPKRDDRDRLDFIFQALAVPDAGAGLVNHKAIIDVLIRMSFPTHPHKTFAPEAPKGGFEGMAERLDPRAGGGAKPFVISGETAESLAALVVGLQAGNAVSEAVEFPLLETKDHFIKWCIKMDVLGALDRFFEVLLHPYQEMLADKEKWHGMQTVGRTEKE